jgi:hypothetical protein
MLSLELSDEFKQKKVQELAILEQRYNKAL